MGWSGVVRCNVELCIVVYGVIWNGEVGYLDKVR